MRISFVRRSSATISGDFEGEAAAKKSVSPPSDRMLPQRRIRNRQSGLLPRLCAQQHHAVEPVLIDKACDAIIRKKRVTRISKQPLRHADLAFDLENWTDGPISLRVQVPPTGAIRNEVERSIRRPFGLENRIRSPSPRRGGHWKQMRQPQDLRPTIRYHPTAFEDGASRSMRAFLPSDADARKRIEVIAGQNDFGLARTIGRQAPRSR